MPHLSGAACSKPPHIRVPRCDNGDELGGQLLLLCLFQLGTLERIQPFPDRIFFVERKRLSVISRNKRMVYPSTFFISSGRR